MVEKMTEDKNALLLAKVCGESLKSVVETVMELIKRLLGEPIKICGDMLSDQLYLWQWKNRIRIVKLAKKKMDENNIAVKVLPPGFFLPLLEAAGNVEEPTLQEMWANLLSSGVKDESHRHPSYTKTLSEFSVLDAKIFAEVCRNYKNMTSNESKPTSYDLSTVCEPLGVDLYEATKVGYNLQRLGLCEARIKFDKQNKMFRTGNERLLVISIYGIGFAEACGN